MEGIEILKWKINCDGFMGQSVWAIECPDTWSYRLLVVSMRLFYGMELEFLSQALIKQIALPICLSLIQLVEGLNTAKKCRGQ
jgi:hypothetical protein